MDVPVSVVGGVVRDALLGRDVNEDVDLVVEGDAVDLATHLGHLLNARVVTHGRFGTATVELPHEPWIDLATARRERYPRPGALPVVEPGSLVDDLARRDFSINAIAYRLTGPDRGQIVDPLGGRADLDAGLIRVLHTGSFVDDPSRVLRAVRYAARLGFALESQTEAAARASARHVDHRSARVGDELRRLLSEPTAATAVELAVDLGVDWLTVRHDLARRFERLSEVLADDEAPKNLELWALRLGDAVIPSLLSSVAVDGWARGLASEMADGPQLLEALQRHLQRSRLDALFQAAKEASVVSAAADAKSPADVLSLWSRSKRFVLEISGEDLVRAGVAPGPAIGRSLRAVRAGVFDGVIGDDPEAQLESALEFVRNEQWPSI